MLKKTCTFIALLIFTIGQAQSTYFVTNQSEGGSDTNLGTITAPFATVNHALSQMIGGDTCYLRGGVYHEEILIDGFNGTSTTVITAYDNEFVRFDGTQEIQNNWTLHSGNIYKTTLTAPIWQLFVDSSRMVMARWPNAQFNDESAYSHDTWAEGIEPSSNNGFALVDSSIHDLGATGIDFTGAIGIMNVGSFKTWTQRILNHTPGTNNFVYDSVPNNGYRTKHHYYFFEGKLEFLDTVNEWFYDTTSHVIYLNMENGQNPNNNFIQGKVQDYAITMTNSSNVEISELYFFATTFKAQNCSDISIRNNHFSFPSCSKRMLQNLDKPLATQFGSTGSGNEVHNSILEKCLFEHTDGEAFRVYGNDNIIENNYLHHIDYTASELEFLMVTVNIKGDNNTFTKNTIHSTGASATIAPGNSSEVSYNDVTQTGSLQSDGAVHQGTSATVQNSNLHHNWIYQTPKYALRFDAPGGSPGAAGQHGKIHHNVVWSTNGIMVKGNHHYISHNTCFSNNGNGLIILDEDSSNDSTYIQNNIASKLSAHRQHHISLYPVPGFFDHNWNGYDMSPLSVSDVIDTITYIPLAGSSVIDAGIVIPQIPHTVVGTLPDIGAYEFGGIVWTAGADWSPNFFPWNDPTIVQDTSSASLNTVAAFNDEFLVYPNPFNETVTIESISNKTEQAIVSIYSSTGQLIGKTLLTNGKKSIDLHDLDQGVYWVNIQSESGSNQLKPIIKK